MNWWQTYFAVGLAVFPISAALRRIEARRDTESVGHFLRTLRRGRQTRGERLRADLLELAFEAVVVVPGWPFAVFGRLRGLFRRPAPSLSAVFPEHAPFEVRPGHRTRRMTLREIEAREVVRDPLKAAPELPFGHLNAAWRAFAAGVREHDEVWAFEAVNEPAPGVIETRSGYARFSGASLQGHFLTAHRIVDCLSRVPAQPEAGVDVVRNR